MYGLLSITTSDLQNVAAKYATSLSLPSSEIQSILESYVSLGSQKKIADYGASTITQRFAISQTVANDANDIFSNTITPPDCQNVLNQLTLDSAQGIVSPEIAYPNKWETQLESSVTIANASSPAGSASDTSISGAVSRVFSGLSNGAQSAISGTLSSITSGLGINLQSLLIIAVVGIILVFYFRTAKA